MALPALMKSFSSRRLASLLTQNLQFPYKLSQRYLYTPRRPPLFTITNQCRAPLQFPTAGLSKRRLPPPPHPQRACVTRAHRYESLHRLQSSCARRSSHVLRLRLSPRRKCVPRARRQNRPLRKQEATLLRSIHLRKPADEKRIQRQPSRNALEQTNLSLHVTRWLEATTQLSSSESASICATSIGAT